MRNNIGGVCRYDRIGIKSFLINVLILFALNASGQSFMLDSDGAIISSKKEFIRANINGIVPIEEILNSDNALLTLESLGKPDSIREVRTKVANEYTYQYDNLFLHFSDINGAMSLVLIELIGEGSSFIGLQAEHLQPRISILKLFSNTEIKESSILNEERIKIRFSDADGSYLLLEKEGVIITGIRFYL